MTFATAHVNELSSFLGQIAVAVSAHVMRFIITFTVPSVVFHRLLRSWRLNSRLVLGSVISEIIHLFDRNEYMNITLYTSPLWKVTPMQRECPCNTTEIPRGWRHKLIRYQYLKNWGISISIWLTCLTSIQWLHSLRSKVTPASYSFSSPAFPWKRRRLVSSWCQCDICNKIMIFICLITASSEQGFRFELIVKQKLWLQIKPCLICIDNSGYEPHLQAEKKESWCAVPAERRENTSAPLWWLDMIPELDPDGTAAALSPDRPLK